MQTITCHDCGKTLKKGENICRMKQMGIRSRSAAPVTRQSRNSPIFRKPRAYTRVVGLYPPRRTVEQGNNKNTPTMEYAPSAAWKTVCTSPDTNHSSPRLPRETRRDGIYARVRVAMPVLSAIRLIEPSRIRLAQAGGDKRREFLKFLEATQANSMAFASRAASRHSIAISLTLSKHQVQLWLTRKARYERRLPDIVENRQTKSLLISGRWISKAYARKNIRLHPAIPISPSRTFKKA